MVDLITIIFDQLESLQEQQKAASNGAMKYADFLDKANTLLTLEKYISEIKSWPGSVVAKEALDPFLSAWEVVKNHIHLL